MDLSHYGDYPEAELYLSLVTLSDEALKELIDHYQQVDEPTMIIVYGDHQPALGDDTDEWLFGSNAGPLSMFETPFLIWTNYPIESRNVGDMSANYLPMLILETANMPPAALFSASEGCLSGIPGDHVPRRGRPGGELLHQPEPD